MTRTTLAVAADYADAMMVARRAKNTLFFILLLVLLAQITIFLLAKYGKVLPPETGSPVRLTMQTQPTTEPSGAGARNFSVPLKWVIDVTDFLGVTLVIVLAIVLLLIVTIMLVGRLIGVSHVTSAFIYCVVLAVLFLPWQSLLNSTATEAARYGGPAASASVDTTPDIKIPGVLYTWPELVRDYTFENTPLYHAILKWARYVGFPVLALLILLLIQGRSTRGLRYALGEADVHVDVTAPTSVSPNSPNL